MDANDYLKLLIGDLAFQTCQKQARIEELESLVAQKDKELAIYQLPPNPSQGVHDVPPTREGNVS